MQFLHAAAGYPVPSTLMNAIKRGYYIAWPGLSAKKFCKHLPKSPITSRECLEQKNIQSTKQVQTDDENMDDDPTQEMDNIKAHEIFAIIVEE
eukprot:1280572-Ditylum_brightwellii.AAC.1